MWDYTCKHTLAASNVLGCSKEAGSAAIAAEEIKRKKYSELAKENHYIPIAQETLVIVRSDEFNDRGKVGIKARSPQTSPWTKKIHLMFIKITLPNIGRRPRVIACTLIFHIACKLKQNRVSGVNTWSVQKRMEEYRWRRSLKLEPPATSNNFSPSLSLLSRRNASLSKTTLVWKYHVTVFAMKPVNPVT